MGRNNSKKMKITIEFTNFDKIVDIELINSHSPKTVKAILNALPLRVKINRWGDELYADKTPIVVENENARSIVDLLDVAYWPEGHSLCLFYGPTPISKSPDEILAYSPVNIVGKIISKNNILDHIKNNTIVTISKE
jgi:uncharacterized protein